MFAVLGNVEFNVIAYWDGFDASFGADYAEHNRIEGKPGLQFIGAKLDEMRISLAFHQQYCSPEVELARLNEAMRAHQAMALVFGNGDYRGWFVITALTSTSQHTDSKGNVLAMKAELTLREYIGDPKNPLKPPAIKTPVPNVSAISNVAAKVSDFAQSLRTAVTYAKKAQSAIKAAKNTVQIVKRMKKNPSAALLQVPELLTQVSNVLTPLSEAVPALDDVAKQVSDAASTAVEMMPDITAVNKAANDTLKQVKQIAVLLKEINSTNVIDKVESISKQIDAASDTFNEAAPALSKLTAEIVKRVN
ncbi:phage tail protein [Pectobacterium fontis]|uniref:Phage P2 GpU family protein n=1 Tax=Pectobacterium fontis TaxID=2558042 RepID=A0A7V8L4R9_9GAMM|nr:phage tail protein [Pectobacterium fontis]KHN50965.1 phage P2 GpU family protein [Pectobacterium fontis]